MSPLVYVSILNWNNPADTRRCLDSVFRLDYDPYRVIVVDNGSADDSLAQLGEDGRDFRLIASPRNLGYAGGNNLAIREALAHGADYVWLLNNDAIAEPKTLAQLIGAMQANPTLGMTSPVLRYPEDSSIEYAAGYFDLGTATHRITCDLDEARLWQGEHADRISLVGTALLIRASLIRALGPLDESLFAYWEDTDLSIRANAAGFRNLAVLDANVFHVKTPPEISERGRQPHFYYYMTRNELLLWRKHLSGALRLKASLWSVLRALPKIDRRADDPRVGEACLAGLWDGLTGRTGEYHPSRRMPEPWKALLYRTRRVWPKLLARGSTR